MTNTSSSSKTVVLARSQDPKCRPPFDSRRAGFSHWFVAATLFVTVPGLFSGAICNEQTFATSTSALEQLTDSEFRTIEIVLERRAMVVDSNYSVTLRGDGSGTFAFLNGNVRKRKFQIKKQELQELLRKLESSEFFMLKDDYNPFRVVDVPFTTIAVRIKDRAKRVVYCSGCAPKELENLESLILKSARVDRFIKTH